MPEFSSFFHCSHSNNWKEEWRRFDNKWPETMDYKWASGRLDLLANQD
jgi:hypothetical protein